MGMRNPWRVSIDSRTGYVYWGEVGPSDQRATGGPTPYDEFNQARAAGFFGFPYFIGDNEGRLGSEGPGNGHPLFLATGELVRSAIGQGAG